MSLAFKRLRVYVRAGLVVLVAAAIVVVLVKNRGNEVPVWFFWLTDANEKVNVVWLMLCTAAGALVARWALSLVWGLRREVREVRRLAAAKKADDEMVRRDSELKERERRLDEKLQRAISSDEGEEG